jgi:hypothetical protein
MTNHQNLAVENRDSATPTGQRDRARRAMSVHATGGCPVPCVVANS